MGSYDSKSFSREFSRRTKENLEFITKAVNRDETVLKAEQEFLCKFDGVNDQITKIVSDLRNSARAIPSEQKGKSPIRASLYNSARNIEELQIQLKRTINDLSSIRVQGQRLFEVTQLLNSLMGIAVLPYEMHSELFDSEGDDIDSIKASIEYDRLLDYILSLYEEGKWITTYNSDLRHSKVNEDKIVFGFLRHLRNAVCHSGNDSMSLLPLSEGTVIEEILFYDHIDKVPDQEFAMRLSVDELTKLVKCVSDFYNGTRIGYLDKTEKIKQAEDRIKKLLEGHKGRNGHK